MEKKEIITLAERFLQGIATEHEKALLHQWYDSWQDDEEVIMATQEDNEEIIRKKVLSRLKQSIQPQAPLPSIKKSTIQKRWLAAASVLLISAVAGYFIYTGNSQNQPIASVKKSPKNDVAPGGNKAILTLADGSTIIRDSAQNGNLAQQGSSQVFKQKDGELVYNSSRQTDPTPATILYNTISTPRGGQYQLVLPDGSKVWLNAASSLRYPTAFTGIERKVELTGEAYFEVTSITSGNRKKLPFIVAVKDMAVKVLGTDFNINAYDDEADIKTTLLKGSVDVTATSNSQTIRLTPGQQSVYNGNMKLIKGADTEQAVAWKNGLFKFNSADLPMIMRQISRWYDVDITYDGNVKEETFSGDMPRKQNASEVFKMLEMTKTVQFSIENKKVIIEPYKK
jgi:transmembrane sensor